MKRVELELSENGWEYTGHVNVTCVEGVEMVDDETIMIDGKIKVKFDEEIVITKIEEI